MSNDTDELDLTQTGLINSLSGQQRHAYDLIAAGKNVYLGGIAGSGKSYMIDVVKNTLTDKNIVVTGTTGISAQNVGGVTLHSWAKFGICRDYAEICERYLDAIIPNREYYEPKHISRLRKTRFRETDILIIDEISIMPFSMFSALNQVAKRLRGNSKPMGGIQIILVGDFCQLPPIVKSQGDRRGRASAPYCFLCPDWYEVVDDYVFLTDNFRQEGDKEYYRLLLDARRGYISPEHDAVLRSRIRRPPVDSDIQPTLLYSKNINVDRENSVQYNALIMRGNEQMTFGCMLLDTPTDVPRAGSYYRPAMFMVEAYAVNDITDQSMEKIKQYLVQSGALHHHEVYGNHCVGAQVMCTVNRDTELVNGSRGIIVGFVPAPGNTTDMMVPQVKFKTGTVALEYQTKAVNIPNRLFNKTAKLCAGSSGSTWCWVSYIPLRHAWALTIHKSQGLTLDMVRTSLGRRDIFTFGMGYVVLSRVKNLKSLYLDRYDKAAIYSDKVVDEFYDYITD